MRPQPARQRDDQRRAAAMTQITMSHAADLMSTNLNVTTSNTTRVPHLLSHCPTARRRLRLVRKRQSSPSRDRSRHADRHRRHHSHAIRNNNNYYYCTSYNTTFSVTQQLECGNNNNNINNNNLNLKRGIGAKKTKKNIQT